MDADLDKVIDAIATLVLVNSRCGESSASGEGGEDSGEGLHCVVELDEMNVAVTSEERKS